jgi:hypothetical protein
MTFAASQCAINTGTVIDASRPRVAPPRMRSTQRDTLGMLDTYHPPRRPDPPSRQHQRALRAHLRPRVLRMQHRRTGRRYRPRRISPQPRRLLRLRAMPNRTKRQPRKVRAVVGASNQTHVAFDPATSIGQQLLFRRSP